MENKHLAAHQRVFSIRIAACTFNVDMYFPPVAPPSLMKANHTFVQSCYILPEQNAEKTFIICSVMLLNCSASYTKGMKR